MEPLAQSKRLGHLVAVWTGSCNAQDAFNGILVPIYGVLLTALNSRDVVLEPLPRGNLVTYWRDEAPVFQIEMIREGEQHTIRLLASPEGVPADSDLATKCLEHFTRWFQEKSRAANAP